MVADVGDRARRADRAEGQGPIIDDDERPLRRDVRLARRGDGRDEAETLLVDRVLYLLRQHGFISPVLRSG